MHHHRPRWQKWLFVVVKLLVLGLLVWFLRDMLTKAVAQLREHTWQIRPAWLVLAGVCYVVGITPSAVFWNRVMRAAGQDVGMFETIRAAWVSQIIKYIPGKAMVLVVRTGMLRNPKIETTVVAASVFVETLTMMAVGSLLSLVILVTHNWQELAALLNTVYSFGDLLALAKHNTVIAVVAAFGMFIGMALPTWPPLMKLLVKLMGVGRFNPGAADKLGRVPYRVLAGGWLIIAAGWFVQGLGLWATLRSLDVPAPLSDVPMNTAAVAMGTVAGFLSFIPGGAGVRELVQTELMVGSYGQGPALVATIIWRLVMLVAEVIVSSILYVLGPRGLRHKLGGRPVPTATTAEG
jgi:uncharacterized membrane protein YbhN (UPF0104 family)